jgi:TRAP-type C4-dicarboxylate transport system permease small subunit
VGAVPSGGGQVVLSRLAWPGYTVSAGTLADPDRDYLVTVNVPADAAGTVIELDFQPPGWSVAVAAFALGMVLMVLLSVLHLIQRMRNRRRTGTITPASPLEGSITSGSASEVALER